MKRLWAWFRGLRRRWQFAIVVLAVALIAAVAVGPPEEDDDSDVASSGTSVTAREDDDDREDEETSTTQRQRTTTTTRPTTTTTTAPPVPSFDDGKHRVGEDIQPGIYRNADVDDGCYWARLSGFGGGVDDIIANDNASGSAVVEIVATDEGFESTRCGEWRMDTSRITDSTTSFGEGTFIVGTDLEPGQWRSSGGDGCYWARLSNFRGGVEGVIANDNVDEPTIVEIAPSDVGFTSTRCGTWEKIG